MLLFAAITLGLTGCGKSNSASSGGTVEKAAQENAI
jgi:hypothetical protein